METGNTHNPVRLKQPPLTDATMRFYQTKPISQTDAYRQTMASQTLTHADSQEGDKWLCETNPKRQIGWQCPPYELQTRR